MERIISTNIVVYKSLWSRYILGYISLWSGYILVILQYTTVYGEDILQIYCRIQQFKERIYSRYIVGYNSLWSGYILDLLQDTTVYGVDIFQLFCRIQQFMERIYSTQDISESKTLYCGRVTQILQTSGERQEGIYKVTHRGVYSSIHLPPFFESNLIFFCCSMERFGSLRRGITRSPSKIFLEILKALSKYNIFSLANRKIFIYGYLPIKNEIYMKT